MKNKPVFILLAGGKSKRMGIPKGLLKYKNNLWILEQLHRISKTTIEEVYIALGFDYELYFKEINWLENATQQIVNYKNLNIKVIINPQPEYGSFSTLQTVLKQLNCNKSILLNPIDVPLLNNVELQHIISEDNEIVLPNYKGKNGHPIKLAPSFWQHLTTLKLTDKDARLDYQLKKVNSIKISKIEVYDKTILKNLNTKLDWNSYINETLK